MTSPDTTTARATPEQIKAAYEAANAAARAFVYSSTADREDRATRVETFRAALNHLRNLTGEAAIHLDALDGAQ